MSADFLLRLFSFVLYNFQLSASSAGVISHRSLVQLSCGGDPMEYFGVCLFSLNQFFLRKSLSGLNKLMFVKNLEQSMAGLNIFNKWVFVEKETLLVQLPHFQKRLKFPFPLRWLFLLVTQVTCPGCCVPGPMDRLLSALIKSFPAPSVGRGLTSRYTGSLALASTHPPPSLVKL